jgi:hypothetical protein
MLAGSSPAAAGTFSPDGVDASFSSLISSSSSFLPGSSLSEGASASPVAPPLPSSNRVRVAVRIRPPFEEEGMVSAVSIPPSALSAEGRPKLLHLEVSPSKVLEFTFDAVFAPGTTNAEVYDEVAGPIVDGVLKGVNGSILAYGQTGSGKTYSLGILTRVSGESGIVPRSLSHIFGAVAASREEAAAGTGPGTTYTISMSFLQVYLDCVMDLLAAGGGGGAAHAAAASAAASSGGALNTSLAPPSSSPAPAALSSLHVREDPARGFYVEGLREYTVENFADACALLNYGLAQRVLGSTRMNATSSRSHTLLIVKVEARTPVASPLGEGLPAAATATAAAAAAASPTPPQGSAGYLVQRSQLMLCDLAGSERVRRTSSRGARLGEARAINASLHTLGQVISALALHSAAPSKAHYHIPWRDNKLTRLLYGNLGGSAQTYLLAALGPAPANASETLSTLNFASRCMRVSAHPVMNNPLSGGRGGGLGGPGGEGGSAAAAAVAAAEHLAAHLQSKLVGLEASHSAATAALVERYEAALLGMAGEVAAWKRVGRGVGGVQQQLLLQGGGGGSSGITLTPPFTLCCGLTGLTLHPLLLPRGPSSSSSSSSSVLCAPLRPLRRQLSPAGGECRAQRVLLPGLGEGH